MILVIIAVLIILFVLGAFLSKDFDLDGLGVGMMYVTGIALVILFIVYLMLIHDVKTINIVDDKIAMYQKENEKIENEITGIVFDYMRYEEKILSETANRSAIELVHLYPELKADTLVQRQMEIYLANNDKIKSLKEQQLNGPVYRWWLYFGE